MQQGGLIAESPSGTVDNRLELHRQLVDGILQHLSLPTTQLDKIAAQSVTEAVQREADAIVALSPPPAAPPQEAQTQEDRVGPEQEVSTPPEASVTADMPSMPDVTDGNDLTEADGWNLDDATLLQDTTAPHAATPTDQMGSSEDTTTSSASVDADASQEADSADNVPLTSSDADLPKAPISAMEGLEDDDLLPAVEDISPLAETADASVAAEAPAAASGTSPQHHEPTREELEEELLPVPEEDETHRAFANAPHVDEVLAQGGFLEDMDEASAPNVSTVEKRP